MTKEAGQRSGREPASNETDECTMNVQPGRHKCGTVDQETGGNLEANIPGPRALPYCLVHRDGEYDSSKAVWDRASKLGNRRCLVQIECVGSVYFQAVRQRRCKGLGPDGATVSQKSKRSQVDPHSLAVTEG